MFRNLFLLCIPAAFLAACSGELPQITATPSAPEQPVIATPIPTELPPTETEAPPTATEPPSTGTTPIMVEPPEQRPPLPINSEHLPEREDSNLAQGSVFLDHAELLIMESYPVQIALALQGSLPTPCNQLRVIARPPDEQNRIQIEVYSVVDPEQICIQVLEPLVANIGLGSFPTGHYSVWVNGEMIGEFDS